MNRFLGGLLFLTVGVVSAADQRCSKNELERLGEAAVTKLAIMLEDNKDLEGFRCVKARQFQHDLRGWLHEHGIQHSHKEGAELVLWLKKELRALEVKQREDVLMHLKAPPFNYTHHQVDVTGLDKALVLKALFDYAVSPKDSPLKWARPIAFFKQYLQNNGANLHVVEERSLYVDLSKDMISVSIYNDQNGDEVGEKVIAALKSGNIEY